MKICQKTKHELSVSAHARRRGSACGAIGDTREAQLAQEPAQTPTSPVLSCWAEEPLTLLTDFAKTAIYISKSFYNKLLFQHTYRWKVPVLFFSPNLISWQWTNTHRLCWYKQESETQGPSCGLLLLCSSGTKWIHLQEEKGMCRAQWLGLDLGAAIRRGRVVAQGGVGRSALTPGLLQCSPSLCLCWSGRVALPGPIRSHK